MKVPGIAGSSCSSVEMRVALCGRGSCSVARGRHGCRGLVQWLMQRCQGTAQLLRRVPPQLYSCPQRQLTPRAAPTRDLKSMMKCLLHKVKFALPCSAAVRALTVGEDDLLIFAFTTSLAGICC